MSNKSVFIFFLVIISLAVVISIAAFPYLPESVASHWNAKGQADGYMPKFWGVFLMPIIMLGLFFLFWLIPKIDPLKKNIESFRKYYNGFWLAITAFMFYVFLLTIIWNFGARFSFTLLMIPGIAILFYVVGVLLDHSKRNWFVGIRTPWTLSSDVVWEKTHKLGAKLFKFAGFVSLFGFFVSDSTFALAAIVVPVLAVALITIVYSYFEYRKLNS